MVAERYEGVEIADDWNRLGEFQLDLSDRSVATNLICCLYLEYKVEGRLLVSGQEFGPRICGTQVKSSVRMKKMHVSSKWLFLGDLIPEIESKAPN